MFKSSIPISLKLPIIIVLISIIASVVAAGVVLRDYSEKSYEAANEKLSAINSSRKSSINDYFLSVKQDLSFLSKNPYIRNAIVDFKKGWDALGQNQKETL